DRAADVEAVHPGKADVEDDDPDRVALELDERFLAAADPQHPIAVAREVAVDELADRRLVFDQENRPGHQPELSALLRRSPPPGRGEVTAEEPEGEREQGFDHLSATRETEEARRDV